MKQSVVLFILLFFSACSTTTSANDFLAKSGVDYLVTTKDQLLDRRFLISIQSMSDKDICLYDGTWPNLLTYRQNPDRGELIKGLGADIRVESKTATYLPRTPTICGHCQTANVEDAQKICSERLEAGQRRTAMLPYYYFDLDILEDEDDNKKLDYSANLVFCDVFP